MVEEADAPGVGVRMRECVSGRFWPSHMTVVLYIESGQRNGPPFVAAAARRYKQAVSSGAIDRVSNNTFGVPESYVRSIREVRPAVSLAASERFCAFSSVSGSGPRRTFIFHHY